MIEVIAMKSFTDPTSERGGGGERDRQTDRDREREREREREEEDQIEGFHQDRKCVSYLPQKPTLNIFTPDG